MITLYDYFRSTAAYRVRIALHYKTIDYQSREIHLTKQGGEQHSKAYHDVNPQGLVPALIDDHETIIQSLAILEYIEEKYPKPHLLSDNRLERAKIRAIAEVIVCDIHPLNNLRVLQYLKDNLETKPAQTIEWYHHWLKEGFDSLEIIVNNTSSKQQYCVGDALSLADVCLIPQVFNAKRFDFPMDDYPCLMAINQHCLSLPCFIEAHPDKVAKKNVR